MVCWRCGAPNPEDRHDLPPTPGLSRLSAIEHLLQTNHPPADAEIPVLDDFTAIARRRMEALTARIESLTPTLNQLMVQREQLGNRIQQCASALSPIRRLPPEIVQEIFSWTLPRTRRVAGNAPTEAPWYLGQISGIWREIALGLSSLWNAITLVHNKDFSCVRALPLVQTQLIRSTNAPLHVDFEWTMEERDASVLLAYLSLHSDRWGSFRLICSNSNALLELMQPAQGQLARLDILEIEDSGREEDDASASSALFSIAPNLRQVLLTNASFNRFSPPLQIPWQQLTHYRGVDTVEQLLHILQAASSLVDGALGFTHNEQEQIPDGPIIDIPNLRRLFTERGEFLARLAAPQLESLSCDPVRETILFVQRSSCRLTTLVMADTSPSFAMTSEAVILLLQHTPVLKNLVLQASALDQAANLRVMSALTITGSSSDLCPNLTFLAYCAASSGTGDSLIAMVRSRRQPDRLCQLSSLRVFFSSPEDAVDVLDVIQRLIAEGLVDLKIIHDPSQYIKQARYSFDIVGPGI
ncbi:hypothetical protein C8R47DRAFT_657677 [Mycena vitilis]|nr:hypothetical protein C8R47DRAFT_657677 [Mycena vitilis]